MTSAVTGYLRLFLDDDSSKLTDLLQIVQNGRKIAVKVAKTAKKGWGEWIFQLNLPYILNCPCDVRQVFLQQIRRFTRGPSLVSMPANSCSKTKRMSEACKQDSLCFTARLIDVIQNQDLQ